VKYDIQPAADGSVRIALTPSGRLAECASGALLGILWGGIGGGVIFLPDYIFKWSEQSGGIPDEFLWAAAAVVSVIACVAAYRRGVWTRSWEIDRPRGVLRRHARTFTLAKVVDLEFPLDAIKSGGDERDVAFELPGGSVYVVARRPPAAERRVLVDTVFGGTPK
jgi:hypothetical protein